MWDMECEQVIDLHIDVFPPWRGNINGVHQGHDQLICISITYAAVSPATQPQHMSLLAGNTAVSM
jgi:hypothetical protein